MKNGSLSDSHEKLKPKNVIRIHHSSFYILHSTYYTFFITKNKQWNH